MKKLLIILLILFMIIIFSIYALFISKKVQTNNLTNYNREYEKYSNKTIYGTELATLINKVTNINENNKIEKNEKNHYIENEENSIKIEITMLLTEKTYPMEEIYNTDTAEFVKHFNLEKFKCTKIEYHKKTGKISKMLFEQIEE
ncbi:MAG: hypothetical protein J6A29_04060 [Clostridia bacterium]|nr:hypothetical protein [Clostridia bacterium]